MDRKARDFKINLENLVIKILSINDWYLAQFLNRIYISIHSPNNFPEEDSFRLLDVKHRINMIEFNQITTELLGEGYDTNCYEYDLDYKFANFNMRSDCIYWCIQNFIKTECNLKGIMFTKGFFRQDIIENSLLNFEKFNIQNYTCQKEMNDMGEIICSKQCKYDCKFKYFSSSYLQESTHIKYWIAIIVRHNTLPDIYLQYLPQTTFLSLVCNFAGILGLWLGLSFLHLFNTLNIFSIKIFHNYLVRIPRINRRIFKIR